VTWWMPWVLWIAGEVVLVMALAETLKRLALKPDPARWARWRWTMRAPSILLALLGTLYSPVYASAGLLDSPVGVYALAASVGALAPLLYDLGTRVLRRKAADA